jgi:hypothetical protein
MYYYLNSKGGFNEVETTPGKKIAGIQAMNVHFGGDVVAKMTKAQLKGRLVPPTDAVDQSQEEFDTMLAEIGVDPKFAGAAKEDVQADDEQEAEES